MASAGVNVPGAGSGDGVGSNPSAAAPAAVTQECRMRRRRRLEPQQGSGSGSGSSASAGPSWVRRVRPTATRLSPSSSSSPPGQSSGSGGGNGEHQQQAADSPAEVQRAPPLPPAAGLQLQPAAAEPHQPAVAAHAQAAWPVAFGALSLAGRMRMMEDTVSLHPDLCTWVDGSTVHFFAVFDGHGGSHVSALCRERMHEFVAEDLAKEGAMFLRRRQEAVTPTPTPRDPDAGETSLAAFLLAGPPSPAPEPEPCWSEQEEEERAWRAALSRSFRRADAMAALACGCGRVARPSCTCPLSGPAAGIVGSTAVVALLVRDLIVVANCGDSRAVLCRGGPDGTSAVPLSFDHKPERVDEARRIAAAGGRVLYNNGYRVRGILAMSRAIGDRFLRPEVIPVPDFTITARTAEDQCLILATDGMWDVITNDVACNVARECLEDGDPPPPADPADADAVAAAAAAAGGAHPAVGGGHEPEPRCLRAASLLARLAIGRETQDNISIVVVDLKHRE